MSPPRDQTGNDVPADPPPSSMRYLKARLASASAAARRLRDGAPDPLDTVESEIAHVAETDQDFVEEGSLVAPGEGHGPRQRRGRGGTTGGTAPATPAAPGPWSARSPRHPRCRLPRRPTARQRARAPVRSPMPTAGGATDATRSATRPISPDRKGPSEPWSRTARRRRRGPRPPPSRRAGAALPGRVLLGAGPEGGGRRGGCRRRRGRSRRRSRGWAGERRGPPVGRGPP